MLSKHGKTASVIELLTPKLSEFVTVKSYSARKSQIVRLIEMMWAVVKHRANVSLVLIDAFSSRAFWYCYAVALLCRVLRIPYAPILHGGDFPNRLNSSPRATRLVFGHSAINISPSRFLQEHFERAGFEVRYIPNFLDVAKYNVVDRSFDQPKLLWVRSFHSVYNPVLAVEALGLLKAKYPGAVLCMVGPDKDGSFSNVQKRVRELSLGDSVKFTGLLSKDDWVAESRFYNIFINTTNFDNMPISVIEAMALGFPIVSTKVGGIPFLIEDGVDGLLVSAGSASEFAHAVDRIMSDRAFGKVLGESARRKALTFDWMTVKKQWSDVIGRFEMI